MSGFRFRGMRVILLRLSKYFGINLSSLSLFNVIP